MAKTAKPKKPAADILEKRDLARLAATWDLPTIAAHIAAMRQLDRPLRTDEAAFYLTHGRGDPISKGELANRRVNGGGPAFHRAGRWPVYTIAALDKYAERRLGPELKTTSSRAAAWPAPPQHRNNHLPEAITE
jgi:hypothetical protein